MEDEVGDRLDLVDASIGVELPVDAELNPAAGVFEGRFAETVEPADDGAFLGCRCFGR